MRQTKNFYYCLALTSAVLFLLPRIGWGASDEIQTFLKQHCVECHGGNKPKGEQRLDNLSVPTPHGESGELWSRILEVVETGEMPPTKQPRPAKTEIATFLRQVTDAMATASGPRPLALRRMNRVEYENTIHDLLGIDAPMAELLPEDGSVQGFDNVADGLGISAILMERYLEAANFAFDHVIRRVQPLPAETRRVELMQVKDNIDSVKKKKGGTIEVDGAFVKFTPGWPPARMDPINPIEAGEYRCRVAMWPHNPSQRTLAIAIYVGPLFGSGKRRPMGIFDVTGTPEKPRVVEFTTYMDAGDAIQVVPRIFPEHVTYRDKHEPRPGIGIVWAETHGPLDQQWPAASQTKLFGDSETIKMVDGNPIWMRHRRGVKAQLVESSAPRNDIERILRDFIPRAFRRPVDSAQIQPYIDLALDRLDQGRTFEQAVRAGVTAVLCSPQFLLINREPQVDDYTLASRMSYFLWSTMPDDELLRLADEGKLSDPQVRQVQVERMLNDPRSQQFVENFTGQWLDQRDIEFTTPDKKLYPEFDELLQEAMLAETREFFTQVLKNNLSVLNFVDSDFTFLNERLANHYGIEGVKGHESYQRVKLPENSVRGGVLTQASVLKVTANGTSTSPVMRGVWVLDNLLGEPAPPPPQGVPAVEPDIRGATTIREQLEKHRAIESCARCHQRIDPPGFALESFDPIGGERKWYRSMGEGEKVRNVHYRIGPTVDASGVTPDNQEFDGIEEFKQLLLGDPDRVAQAIARKLLIYGTGRSVTGADRDAVLAVVQASRKQNFGLRSMVHAVVQNEMFTRP